MLYLAVDSGKHRWTQVDPFGDFGNVGNIGALDGVINRAHFAHARRSWQLEHAVPEGSVFLKK